MSIGISAMGNPLPALYHNFLMYGLEILKFREVGADVFIRVGFVWRIFIGTKFSAMAD